MPHIAAVFERLGVAEFQLLVIERDRELRRIELEFGELDVRNLQRVLDLGGREIDQRGDFERIGRRLHRLGQLPLGPLLFERDRRLIRVLDADAGHGVCRSEEHTSELQSLMRISYAVFCLKKKKTKDST